MRVIFVGAGHWHLPLYREPLRSMPGVRVVGVCDHDKDVADRIAAREGCFGATDLARLIERTEPDLAFVLGRHSDMAASARMLVEAGIPFVLEKPGGVTSREIQDLARAAETAGTYVSVPLVFRSTGFMAIMRDLLERERPIYAGFKFIAGLPDRYRDSGCDWMLDKALAGGGVLTNLGVHFLDLLDEIFAGADLAITQAEFARFAGLGDVEDFASLTLRAGEKLGCIETGYLYPAPTGIFDMHFSIRTEGHYVTAVGPGRVEVTTLAGDQTQMQATTTNMEVYPAYVRDVVRQVREGARPIAGLNDLVRLSQLLEQAYGFDGATGGRG